MVAIGTSWTTIATKTDGRFHLKYQMYYANQSVANNTTQVYRRLLLTIDTYGAMGANTYAYSGTGMTSASGGSVSLGAGDHVLLSGNSTVTHNSDGTWSQSVTGTANFGGTYIWTTPSTTATLPTIPRTSQPTVSASRVYIGGSVTVSTNRASTSFTHDITAKFGSTVHTIATGVGDSAVFATTDYVAALVAAQSSGETAVVFTVTTKSGSTTIGSATCSCTVIINPSVPTLSSSTVTIGNSITVTTNRTTSARTHTVAFKIGSGSSTNIATNVGTSTAFNTNTYLTQFMTAAGTNKSSVDGTITVTTYLSGSSIGSKSIAFTAKVNTSTYKPTITFGTLADTNSVSKNYRGTNQLIQNLSAMSLPITFGVSNTTYESLVSATVQIGSGTAKSVSVSGTSTSYTATQSAINADTVTVTVTDARGTTVTSTKSFTLLAYEKPSITSLAVARTTMTGAAASFALKGTAYAGTYSGSSSVTNAITTTYKWKPVGGNYTSGASTYTNALSGSGSKTFTRSATFSESFAYDKQYDIQFTVKDAFVTLTSTVRLYGGVPVYGWAETHFDVYGDFHIHDRDDPTVMHEIVPGKTPIPQYGTCSTASGEAAKTVTLATKFSLFTGACVYVKMSNTNTVASPTLNVNNTGAKAIKEYGTTAAGTSTTTSWYAGAVIPFVYDGTNWIMMAWRNNTTYSSMSTAEADTGTATTGRVLTAANLKRIIVDRVYPVGSIYMSVNNTSPATLFGGTWTQIKDRFLLGVGSTYTAASATGGAANVTLTEDQIPAHTHSLSSNGAANGSGVYKNYVTSSTGSLYYAAASNRASATADPLTSSSTGGGSSHNNMPPYYTVYMWRRTA